jgi:hypothetical protein
VGESGTYDSQQAFETVPDMAKEDHKQLDPNSLPGLFVLVREEQKGLRTRLKQIEDRLKEIEIQLAAPKQTKLDLDS